MKLTIKEAYNLLRTVEARLEWIKDNPDDSSIEEYEKDSLWAVYQKLIDSYIGNDIQSPQNPNSTAEGVKIGETSRITPQVVPEKVSNLSSADTHIHNLKCSDCGEKFPFESHEHICKYSPVSDESGSVVEGIGAIPKEETTSNVYNVARDSINNHSPQKVVQTTDSSVGQTGGESVQLGNSAISESGDKNIIEKALEGCGKRTRRTDNSYLYFICMQKTDAGRILYCPSCKSKLSGMKEILQRINDLCILAKSRCQGEYGIKGSSRFKGIISEEIQDIIQSDIKKIEEVLK